MRMTNTASVEYWRTRTQAEEVEKKQYKEMAD